MGRVDGARHASGGACRGTSVRFADNFTSFTATLLSALRHAPVGDHVSLVRGGLPCANAARGLWLEFGVWQGSSISTIATHRMLRTSERPAVYGFDSFHGLPEHWRDVWRRRGGVLRRAASFPKGHFSTGGQPPRLDVKLDSAVKWVVGWYNLTLAGFLKAHAEPVTFVHVDSDLYSSTQTILKCLSTHIQNGTVIVFDELFNFPEYKDHELLALWEFLGRNRHLEVQVLATSTRTIHDVPLVELPSQSCALKLVRTRKDDAA